MLRRRPDDRFELLLVEEALSAIAPPPLSVERREALRQRIMTGLGTQDAAASWGLRPGERWVLIPAGIGVVAAILAAARYVQHSNDDAEAKVYVRQLEFDTSTPGGQHVVESRWVSFGREVAVGVEPGTSIESVGGPGAVVLQFRGGRATVANASTPMTVVGSGFTANLPANSVTSFESSGDSTTVTAVFGQLVLALTDGTEVTLANGTSHTVIGNTALGDATTTNLPSSKETEKPGNQQLNGPDAATSRAPSAPEPAAATDSNPPTSIVFEGRTVTLPTPAKAPPVEVSEGPSSDAVSSPPYVEPPIPAVVPPVTVPDENEATAPEPAAGPVGNDNSNAGGNGAANSNAGGNGNGAANSNAGGNGNGAANSNAGGNGNGAANSNAGGNSNGAANSNAGGNGNGAGNSNAGGNGNGAANSNAGGNGNGAANSNAGGNGNGNGAARELELELERERQRQRQRQRQRRSELQRGRERQRCSELQRGRQFRRQGQGSEEVSFASVTGKSHDETNSSEFRP